MGDAILPKTGASQATDSRNTLGSDGSGPYEGRLVTSNVDTNSLRQSRDEPVNAELDSSNALENECRRKRQSNGIVSEASTLPIRTNQGHFTKDDEFSFDMPRL